MPVNDYGIAYETQCAFGSTERPNLDWVRAQVARHLRTAHRRVVCIISEPIEAYHVRLGAIGRVQSAPHWKWVAIVQFVRSTA